MIAIVGEKKPELDELCRKHGVRRLDLFGSAASEGEFQAESSDLDFLVEFAPCVPTEHYERYFGLLEDLERLFRRRVDLVEAHAMKNPYFIRRVNESRRAVYAA
ncbi:MAG: nucleotidyltransferase domain-containing protein [Nitrospinae bacterium]|nr:nucleotidyltransferase domain-containing protein [Nitrospinota bacterium]